MTIGESGPSDSAPAPRLVLGVEQSIAGLHALRWAVAQARICGGHVHAVRAWTFTPVWHNRAANRRWHRELATEADRYGPDAFAAAMGAVPTDVAVDLVAIKGLPGPVLVEYAHRETDLLVVGTQRGRFGRIASPTTRYCVAHAHVPVVVVPPPPWARAAAIRRSLRAVGRDRRST